MWCGIELKIYYDNGFYEAYESDAYILHSLFGYRITNGKRVSFPEKSLNRIMNVLEGKRISYVVRKKDSTIIESNYEDNHYDEYLKNSEKLVNRAQEIELLLSSLHRIDDSKFDEIIKCVGRILYEK